MTKECAGKRVLVVIPDLKDMGGVANYFNSIQPLIGRKKHGIAHMEVGSTKGKGNYLYPLIDQWNFFKLMSQNPPDLVHINPSLNLKSFIRDGIFVFHAKRHQIPVLVFFHGWKKEFEKILEKIFLKIFQLSYGKADAFIVLSSEFKKKLISWDISAPIYIETTAVDPELIKDFNIEEKVKILRKRKPLRILFLSRIEKTKGIFETVDAFALLMRRKVPATLSIAGDGSIKNEVETYVKSLRLPQDSVKFLGYVTGKSKTEAFSNHDLYCFPSYGEGLPISVLEAIAFGLPVITCAVGGLADVFQYDKMGAFVPVRDAEAIADLIESINQDREGMASMALFNHSYALENFMAPKVASRLLRIYQRIIERNFLSC